MKTVKYKFINGLIIFVLLLSTFQVSSSNSTSDININSSYNISTLFTLESKSLNRKRNVNIYLPEGYTQASKTYPVLYILDSQHYFLHGISYQQSVMFANGSPEFIVVGVETDRQERNSIYINQSQQFSQFLSQELIPFVDKTYRTNNERMMFGWERAGAFTLQAMVESPELFDAYFIASPTMLRPNRITAVESRLKKDFESEKFLYFGISPLEFWSLDSTESLSTTLKNNPLDNLQWQYKLLEGEDHYSTPAKVIHEGLRSYFNDYPILRYYSIKEFKDAGGIEYLKLHYKQRGIRYGLPTEIHSSTKNYLLILAYRENDYSVFKLLLEEFEGYLESYTRDNWIDSFARFALKNKELDRALEIFNLGLKKFPQSADIINGLGNLYKAKGDLKKAKTYYQQAINIAKNSDSSYSRYLNEYQADLDNLDK